MIRLGLFFFSVIFFTVRSESQKIKSFEDRYGTKGEIRYSGEYTDSLLPKQSALEIRWREVESPGLKTYRVKGQTKNHVPSGRWIWEEADWNYTMRVGDNIRPVFDAKGKHMKWDGNFVEGKPDGKWSYTLDSISPNGQIFGTLIKMSVSYKKGKPTGNFSYENLSGKWPLSVKGNCDTDGIATGTWIYQYKTGEGIPVKEERTYQKGLLTEVCITEGTVKSSVKFAHNIAFIDKFGDNSLIQHQRIGSERFYRDEYTNSASELFLYNWSQHFLRGWNLENFPYEIERGMPQFRQLEYPLDKAEMENREICRELIRQQRDSIESHLTDNISIHRSRSGLLDTSISYLRLSLLRINYIDSLLDRTELPLFTYKDRRNQGLSLWVNELNGLRHTKGEIYDSLKVEIPAIIPSLSPPDIFAEFRKLLLKNGEILPHYFRVIESVNISLRREGELKRLEDQITDQLSEIQLFYAEKKGVGEQINAKWVKGEVQQRLQEYAQSDAYEDALRIGNGIVMMLDSLEAWKTKINEFDNMSVSLKSQYSYMAYNPYTGDSDIEIITKKRFINNVLGQLWPYMLNEIENELDWDKWTDLWSRQFAIYNHLLNFVSQDDTQSKRVEKRVRSEKKPERMLRIIINHMEGGKLIF